MAEVFRSLTDYQHGRERVEMYLGSRELHTQRMLSFDGNAVSLDEHSWVPALYTAWREVVDNALDEIVAHGYGNTIKINYDPDTMVFEVEDNGRGMPLDEKPELGKGPAASILLGQARAGRNFDERGQVAGVNGLGAALVNFTSEWFILDVWRDGQHLRQKWTEGVYKKKEIHKTDGPTISKGAKDRTGTRVRFKPSAKVFPQMQLPLEFIQGRVWDIAVANPKVKVYFNDTRLITTEARKDAVMGTFFKDGKAGYIHTKSDRVDAKFYVAAGITDDEHIHSLINNIPVIQGGSHIDEFRSLFYVALAKYMEPIIQSKLGGKKRQITVTRADVAQGVLIYNVTRMNDPHFNGQTKERLSSEIKGDIRQGFMESDVKGFIRKNPEWTQAVVDRYLARTTSADRKALAKEQNKMKRSKIASLKDATGKRRDQCILFIAEGDSAISGMVSARDAKIHGGLPLTGKIINVHNKSPSKLLESKALTEIMTALGLRFGEKANRLSLRYGQLYIATDADHDGANICALLVNFFYTFWPELFAEDDTPFVNVFCTPLIILTKGKERNYIYEDEYDQFDPSEWKGWQIIRAKGLARLTQVDWKFAIQQPKLIPLIDDGQMKSTLDMIFNQDRADDRKAWLS